MYVQAAGAAKTLAPNAAEDLLEVCVRRHETASTPGVRVV
jgi:hypothetical protein